MENITISLLRALCPTLQAMAKKTANPIDDIAVKIICMISKKEERNNES